MIAPAGIPARTACVPFPPPMAEPMLAQGMEAPPTVDQTGVAPAEPTRAVAPSASIALHPMWATGPALTAYVDVGTHPTAFPTRIAQTASAFPRAATAAWMEAWMGMEVPNESLCVPDCPPEERADGSAAPETTRQRTPSAKRGDERTEHEDRSDEPRSKRTRICRV
jgi:hypothetical protein